MGERNAKEIGEELSRLMREQIESLKKRTFMGNDEEELRGLEARLKRIRELSADYLDALKRRGS